mmetsp:Transcript_31285/g.31565  ORF Transcript_31285/g.31565 Transcript_31285/m.31565 type:complete len:91 (-) Transcript_31285:800-1072(-)
MTAAEVSVKKPFGDPYMKWQSELGCSWERAHGTSTVDEAEVKIAKMYINAICLQTLLLVSGAVFILLDDFNRTEYISYPTTELSITLQRR